MPYLSLKLEVSKTDNSPKFTVIFCLVKSFSSRFIKILYSNFTTGSRSITFVLINLKDKV